MFFAVVKSTANRDDRDRDRDLAVAVRRGRNLDRGTTSDFPPLFLIEFFVYWRTFRQSVI